MAAAHGFPDRGGHIFLPKQGCSTADRLSLRLHLLDSRRRRPRLGLDVEEVLWLSKHPYMSVRGGGGPPLAHSGGGLLLLGDLFSVIRDNDGLSVSYCKTFAMQLAHALDFLHRLRLVHTNLNTENLFVFDRNRAPTLKLSHFEKARAQGDNLPTLHPPRRDNPFIPPEVHSGAAATRAHPTQDWWAFGVVIFCMLTNHYPWRSCSLADPHYAAFHALPHLQQDDGSGGGRSRGEMPYPWCEFSPRLTAFLSRALAGPPEQRATPTEVFSLVCDPWLKPSR